MTAGNCSIWSLGPNKRPTGSQPLDVLGMAPVISNAADCINATSRHILGTRDQAARAFITSEVQPHIENYEVLVAPLLEDEDHSIVGYQTRPALEGDWSKALAGNQPFRVIPGEDSQASTQFIEAGETEHCLLYTSPSPRDQRGSRMPSSA